ncbi:serine phosphatase RsbU, regulator of sigma subunit [Beggiatoa alba B18LD]|uniref:Serine phosphatase RsbU, regulator of sigma subunit n=1 Tax=Beggiatoa alba B18LD TaxID=395493 RepID=I3CJB0_9GAMM|nr:SpoIIE family protein phosphatase [Beggiatoa alba]EIJ43703.1 serine phosphatase RsbU, regulator of sigma subunit [Beggiatoa alba B18LD]
MLPTTALVLIAVGLAGYLSFQSGQVAISSVVAQLRDELNARIQQHLDSYLAMPPHLNHQTAQAFKMGLLSTDKPFALTQHFATQIQEKQGIPYIYFGKNNGQFFGINTDTTPLSYELASDSYPFTVESYNSDDALNPILSPKKQILVDFDSRQRPWYQAAVRANKPVWSEIYSFLPKQELGITHSQSIFSNTGEFLGVAGVDLTLSQISQFLRTLDLYTHGEMFIIEPNGAIIASTTQALTNAKTGEERLFLGQSDNALLRHIAEQLAQDNILLSALKTSTQLDINLGQEKYFLQLSPLENPNLPRWIIGVVLPEDIFMATIHRNTYLTLWIWGFALILSLILTGVFSRRIIKPIDYLKSAVQALANGNWSQPLPALRRQDEIGDLARSFHSMAEQLKNVFDTLETRVAERTLELAQANQEINLLNQQLKAENMRMSTELAITREIQHMVLPRLEELEQVAELEIAVFMEAATEVGGDYYDVLQHQNYVKIGIGDVTGHGLESGVLMLMVQTAIRTLQMSNINDPKLFLSILNQVIYRNVQRMNSDKNLTLSVLDYADGKVLLSGQHEIVLWVKDNGEIERIDTFELGFILGIEPDIGAWVNQREIDLKAGEGLVLYTDGITEARNLEKQLYGIERLCRLITQYWTTSRHVEQIKQAIIDDLYQYLEGQPLKDDVTLIILKRCAMSD